MSSETWRGKEKGSRKGSSGRKEEESIITKLNLKRDKQLVCKLARESALQSGKVSLPDCRRPCRGAAKQGKRSLKECLIVTGIVLDVLNVVLFGGKSPG